MVKRMLMVLLVLGGIANATYKNYHGVAVYGNNIWVVAKDTSRSNVYYSPDFGATWVERPIIRYDLYVPLFDVEFVDPYTGWAVGYEGYIYQTYDGGQTWTLQAYGVSKFITRVKFINEMVGWAACGDAIYARTSSGGNPPPNGWVSGVAIMAMTELYGVAPLDSTTAFVAAGDAVNPGGQGYLAFTSDGGNTWTILIQDSVYDYFDVNFTDEQHGFLVGGLDNPPYTPKLYVSSNGGLTWNEASLPGGTHTLRAITFVNPNYGWAVGEEGTIIRTRDGGNTWELLTSGVSTVLFDVEFADTLNGVAVGDSNTVLITNDGGETWRVLDPQAGIEEDERPVQPAPIDMKIHTYAGAIEVEAPCRGEITVFDASGRITGMRQINGDKVRFSVPSSGVYFVRMSVPNARPIVKKVIVAR